MGFGIGITLPDQIIMNAQKKFFGIQSAVETTATWLLSFNTSTTATIGSSAVAGGTSPTTALVWDSTYGLVLQTFSAGTAVSEGMRWTGTEFVNNDGSGNKLSPSKTGADGNEIFLLYDYWQGADQDVSAGSTVYIRGTDKHNYYMTTTAGGHSGLSIPAVTSADIGSTITDGTITWNVVGRFNNYTETFKETILSTGAFPYEVRFGGGYAWVSLAQQVALERINLSTGKQTTISLGAFTGTNYVQGLDYGAGVVMLANEGGDKVNIVNAETLAVTEVALGAGTAPKGVKFDGTNFWVTLQGTGQIRKIAPDGTLGTTITVGTTPYRLDAHGDDLWVGNFGSNNVSRVSITSETVTATIAVGTDPWQPRYCEEDGYVYVSNYTTYNLSVINPATNTVIDTVSLPLNSGPHEITEVNGKLYVALSATDSTAIVDIATRSMDSTFLSGDNTAGIAFDGVWVWNTAANVNEVRRTYISGTMGGAPTLTHIKSERAATNRVRQSNNLNITWTKRGTMTAVYDLTGPDGNANSAATVSVAASGNDVYQVVPGFTNDVAVDVSFWAKRITAGKTLIVNNALGGSGTWNINTSQLSTDFERITEDHPAVTVVTPFLANGSGSTGLQFLNSDATVCVFGLYGVQAEEGGVSSYIDTTTAAVTRLASSFTVTPTTAEYLRLRFATVESESYITSGTVTISYNGTTLTVTDGTNAMTHAVAIQVGDQICIVESTGQLYYNGVLVDTNASYSPTWGEITVGLGTFVDHRFDADLDPTDLSWSQP